MQQDHVAHHAYASCYHLAMICQNDSVAARNTYVTSAANQL